MKRSLKKGLPGGPNEKVFSKEGYRSTSPDVNNSFNFIPSGNITMKEKDGTPLKKGPLLGIDNLGNSKLMLPGANYQFPGDVVKEVPLAKKGGPFQNSNIYATNKLFAKNPLFKKRKKGKKAKGIYNPKAKYTYDDGGESGCPDGKVWSNKFKKCVHPIQHEDYLNSPSMNNYGDVPVISSDPIQSLGDLGPDGLTENILEFFDFTGALSYDDAKKAYNEWQNSKNTSPTFDQSLSMFGAVPALGKFGKIKYLKKGLDKFYKGFNLSKPVYGIIPWQQILNAIDSGKDVYEDNINPSIKKTKKSEWNPPLIKREVVVKPKKAFGGEAACPEGFYNDPVKGCVAIKDPSTFYENWFQNRVMPTAEGQKLLDKVRPEALERASQSVPYIYTEELNPDEAGYYDPETQQIFLNKFLPEAQIEATKHHEFGHHVQGDKFYDVLGKPHQYLIEQNVVGPKEIDTGNPKWDKNLKKNYDDVTAHEELWDRVMTLRRVCEFEPNKVITEKDIADCFKRKKEAGEALDPDIEDLKGVTKGTQGMVNLLNDMVSVPEQTEDIPYLQPGGELSSDVSVSYLPNEERSYYNPLIDTVYLNPNASEEEFNHEMAHAWQNREDGFRSDPYSPKLRPSTAASDEQAATYFNRKGDDVDRYINNLKTIVPELGGHTWNADLDRFMPDQLKYDKVIDPLMYSDPSTLEGEAEYMSQVYGRPPLGIKKNGGAIEIEIDESDIDKYVKGGYVVEDISVPSLTRMQPGGPVPDSTYTPIDPNFLAENPDTYSQIVNKPEVTTERQGSDIGKLRAEFREKNPMDIFLDEKKRQFLKKNKGLNKAAGVTMDNFPEDVLQNFMSEYDYKTNNYAVNKLGKKEGWNPKRRGEWVDELTPGEKDAVAESKYGSKLQPSYWSRSLAGVQELGNEVIKLLPGEQGDVMKFNIPGLTKKEQKEIRESKLGALETLAPMDMQGAWLANIAKNTGLSTGSDYKELPGILSGEKMANVEDEDAMALNLGNYLGLEALPELGVNLAKGIGSGAKLLPEVINYGADVIGTSRNAGKLQLPKYKNVYRAEHAGFDLPAIDNSFTGRWFADKPEEVSFYVRKLKDPNTGEVILDSDAPVRILKKRLPEYKINQNFGAGMPEEARIMSMGKGDLTDIQLNEFLGPGADRRFKKGVFTQGDLNSMSTAPFLYNPTEGILDPTLVNQLRKNSKLFEGKTDAMKYLFEETEKIKNAKPLQSYLPFNKQGGVVSNLTKKEIDNLIKQGYIIEEID